MAKKSRGITRITKARVLESTMPLRKGKTHTQRVKASKYYDPWQAEKTLGTLRKPDRY